jgi:hypothetical protein
MPGGDRTGPPGGGGRGTGRGIGRGIGRGRNRPGAGSGGNCVCPKCGATVPHSVGTPCSDINCPKCGTKMARG